MLQCWIYDVSLTLDGILHFWLNSKTNTVWFHSVYCNYSLFLWSTAWYGQVIPICQLPMNANAHIGLPIWWCTKLKYCCFTCTIFNGRGCRKFYYVEKHSANEILSTPAQRSETGLKNCSTRKYIYKPPSRQSVILLVSYNPGYA